MTVHDPYDQCFVCGKWHYTHAEQSHAFQSSERYVSVRSQRVYYADTDSISADSDPEGAVFSADFVMCKLCTCHQGVVDPKKPLECARCGHTLRQ